MRKQHNAAVIVISAEIESQLAQLPDAGAGRVSGKRSGCTSRA
jgi:ribosome-binding ATPase YchF (GTP1/OBG family)